MNLAKAMSTVAGLTGLSRVAGFIRDILTAAILGAGPVADAFFVALKLPNFFRRVTAEGAFSVSFVPLYSEVLEKEGKEEADLFSSNAFFIMLSVLSGFTIAVIAAMPWVIHGIAPGFAGGELRYDLAVELSRVTFPYLLLMSLTALLGGVLNALDRFAPFAFAPVLFNLCLIGALLMSDMAETAGHALAWGVFAAGILQFLWLWISARRAGVRIRLVRPHLTPRTKKVFRLMGPGVIGAGVMHINLFADVVIASMLPAGAISHLYYADRLNQLPLGVVGIAVGTALLPMLSRAVAAEKAGEARDLFNRALEYCLLLALPAATALLVIAWPIVVTLFHHGAFDWEAVLSTTHVLTAYAVGLPAYVSVKVFATTFWARQDTTTPVKISVVATAFNIVLSLYLVFITGLGVAGIAAATALAGWVQIGLFFSAVQKNDMTGFDSRFLKHLLKTVLCCAVMGAGLYAAKTRLMPYFLPELEQGLWPQILALGGLVLGGLMVYAGAVMMLGLIRPSQVKQYLFNTKHAKHTE